MRSFAIAAILVCCSGGATADVLDQIDETIASSEILEACHVAPPATTPEQNALVNAKLGDMGNIAWQRFWNELEGHDPSNHEENGRIADHMLKQHMEQQLGKGRALVAGKGCAALVPHAQNVLET